MEKICLRILKCAINNDGYISYEQIKQITKIPLRDNQTIDSYNDYVAHLADYLKHTYKPPKNGVCVPDGKMEINTAGREVVQHAKRDAFRFWFPKWIHIALTVIAVVCAVLTILLNLQVITLSNQSEPTLPTNAFVEDIDSD